MSSRVAVAALLVFTAVVTNAQDWGDFALHSDRSQDSLLVVVLRDSDLDTGIEICRGVGMRQDPYAGAVIDAVLAAGGEEIRSETLLRALLARLLDPARPNPPLAERIRVNAAALGSLLVRMPGWQDPQLVAAVVLILPLMADTGRLPALMDAGERIIRGLRDGAGRLMPQETSLAMDYLRAVQEIGGEDFLAQVASIARLSADGDLVKAARAAAVQLLGPG